MKIQELAIIFVIIILPISLLLSEYTQFQIQTLKTQTEYDSKLTAATYDAIKAFQLNSTNSTESGFANSEMRDLTASVNTFRNSIMSTFRLNGYTEDELNSYIPALVYTLYDGFYMYSPYENENHRYEIARDEEIDLATGNVIKGEEKVNHITGEVIEYEKDAAGQKIPIDENGEKLYGVKPYISYSCRYIKEDRGIDVVITYSLDNHITVQGMVGGKYVNKSGYLIEIDRTGAEDYGIYYKKEDDGTEIVRYNGEEIYNEKLMEYLHLPNIYNNIPDAYPYARITGTKNYLIEDYISKTDEEGNEIPLDCIVYILNGTPIIQAEEGEDEFNIYKTWIENNGSARKYYIDAYNFTKWFQDTDLMYLQYKDAYDQVVNTNPADEITDGEIMLDYLWPENENYIFAIRDGGPTPTSKSIETEFSNFNQHRLAVIRKKIETNLAIAIANYNDYSNVGNVFQIPQLKETEWDSITHNIGLISFMQGLPIGGKLYNGYSIVTNSESDKVVFEENIYILSENTSGDPNQKVYRRIGDKELETTSTLPTAGIYSNSDSSISYISAGRLNLDFERAKVIRDGEMKYYYPLREYNASYNSIVMQNGVTTYDDIYEYIENQDSELAQAFYTALARERGGMYITLENVTSSPSDDENFSNGDEEEGSEENPPVLPYVPLQFTLTYHFRDDYNEEYSVIVTENESISLINPEELIPPRKKEGSVFSGWAESARATKPYYKVGEWTWGTYSTRWHDHLYAIWEAAAYTVKFDAKDGEGAPEEEYKAHDVDLQLPSDIPTKEGYEFVGWDNPLTATSPDWDKEKIVSENAYYTNNADVTLEAVWKPTTYTLTYYPNANEYEVTNLPNKQYWDYGENVTIDVIEPKRDGYIFMGWDIYSTSEFGNSEYTPGNELELPHENINLYAIWKERSTIIFDANGGTITVNGNVGDRITLDSWIGNYEIISDYQIERAGHEFKGWATTQNATTANYFVGDQYLYGDENNILYAVWEAKGYTVTYSSNLESGIPSPQTKTHGEDLELSTQIPTASGYIFVYWIDVQNLKAYNPGDPYSVDADMNLMAVWKANTYTITYDANGGSGEPSQQNKTHGEDLQLATTKPTRSGYNFLGWAEDKNATTAKYQPDQNYTENRALYLYAVWEAEKVEGLTVVYHANGGTGVPEKQIMEKGKINKISTTIPSREGYAFFGWSSAGNSKQIYAFPGDDVEKDLKIAIINGAMINLYAVWGECASPSEIFDKEEKNLNGLHIGDFVNYNAGTWTENEIAAIKTGFTSSPKTANNSTSLPSTGFQFGGFTSGSSRNENVTPNYGTYIKNETGKAVSGWRVFDIEDDGKVILISAGNPEAYYHPYGDDTDTYGYISEYILTGKVNESWSGANTSLYTIRNWDDYVNETHKAISARVLTKSKLNEWYSKYIEDGGIGDIYINVTCLQMIYNESYLRYQNLVDNGSDYWLGETNSALYVRYFDWEKREVFYGWLTPTGVRVLVTLDSSVMLSSEPVDTKTLSGGNMDTYGGPQKYNVWNIVYGSTEEEKDTTKPEINYISTKVYEDQSLQTIEVEFSANDDDIIESTISGDDILSNLYINGQKLDLNKISMKLITTSIAFGEKYKIILTEIEPNTIVGGNIYTDYVGTVSLMIPAGKVSDRAGNVNDATTINFEIKIPASVSKEPYLPNGFRWANTEHTEILDSSNNQYVWVSVPRDATVYNDLIDDDEDDLYGNGIYIDSTDEDILAFDVNNLTTEELTAIETELKEYTATYRNGTTFTDIFYSTYEHGFVDAEAYNTHKNGMLASVFKNEGFYVGKYETGINGLPKTWGDSDVEMPSEIPVIQLNAYPYVCVTNEQAQKLASSMASGEYTSSLLFGVQWDLVLKHLEVTGAATVAELNSDSTEWGNYFNHIYNITNPDAKNYVSTWKNGIYNKTAREKVLLSTGASTEFERGGIYDLAGNVYEWTLEYSTTTYNSCTYRSGDYRVYGNLYPASERSGYGTNSIDINIGFRVCIF